MVLETGYHPALLKDAVTTPAGCTIDGILELEEGGLRVTLIKAVMRATETSQATGSGITKLRSQKHWVPQVSRLRPGIPPKPNRASSSLTTLPIQRPSWLPSYIPELQGLRGIAVLSVVFYHCHPRLDRHLALRASLWGWAGVNLFFVLSGFLITSILLESRNKPHYFRNFYARRALRIWPVYILVLVVCYLNAPWFIGPTILDAIEQRPGGHTSCSSRICFTSSLPPAIGPTWSLAIEEQYYFLWAPVVRFLRRPWMLATLLIAALIASPLFRLTHFAWITPTHTLTHIDGIAMGSLLALGLYTLPLSRRVWLSIGLAAMPDRLHCRSHNRRRHCFS